MGRHSERAVMSVSARWRAQPLWRFAACSAPRFRPATNSQKSSVQVYLLCKISLYRGLLRKETCSHPSPFKCIAARFFIASTLPSSAASCTVIQSHTQTNTHSVGQQPDCSGMFKKRERERERDLHARIQGGREEGKEEMGRGRERHGMSGMRV